MSDGTNDRKMDKRREQNPIIAPVITGQQEINGRLIN
jgi:hypothetical protein